jgi:hypothetical protein
VREVVVALGVAAAPATVVEVDVRAVPAATIMVEI